MVKHSKKPSFKKTPFFSDIERVAGRIVALAPTNRIDVSGSCVRIAPNLYLTARHVLADFINKFGFKNDEELNFTVWIIHVYTGPEYAIWEMDELWLSPHSDLAVLHVRPCNDTAVNHKVVSVNIDLQPPIVGSRVSGWGYHNSIGVISINESGSLHFEISGEEATTVGEVREYHPLGTDKVLRPFPCFRVNARFDGGMSGGPVFSDNGKLCGVICTGLPPYDDGDEHCSYVAATWPLMGLVVGVNPKTGILEKNTYPVFELARHGFISVKGLEKISITQSNLAGMYDVTYRE